jgi:hypothetical protein
MRPGRGGILRGHALFIPEEARQVGRLSRSSRFFPKNQGKLRERLLFPLRRRRYAEMLLNSLVLKL